MTIQSNWWFSPVPPANVPNPTTGYLAFFVSDGSSSTTANALYKKDTAGALTALVPLAFTAEDAQDAVGTILTDSASVDFTYDDAGNSITAIVKDGSITLAKLANLATDTLIGRDTAGTGIPEAVGVTGGIEFNGSGSIQTGAFTGDVTKSAAGTALTIPAGTVTLAKMANIVTDSLIGRDTAGTGIPEIVIVSGGLEFTGGPGIQRSALTGDITASAGSGATTIAVDAVTNTKLANMAASTVKGQIAGGSGDPVDLSVAQLETLRNFGIATRSITTNSAIITTGVTTEVTTGPSLQIPSNAFAVGDTLRLSWSGVGTTTAAVGTLLFRVRMGPTFISGAVVAVGHMGFTATAKTLGGFSVSCDLTIRSLGSGTAATVIGQVTGGGTLIDGISGATTSGSTAIGFDSTVINNIGFTVQPSVVTLTNVSITNMTIQRV